MLGRWQRSLQLARMGLAARRVRAASTVEEQARAQQSLNSQMAAARGLPMKIGQVLAGMNDESEYSELTRSVKPWPTSEITPVLELAWGGPIERWIETFEASEAAASLGQVHKARLCDGNIVAIKVQYPDIAKAVQAELKLANLLPGMGPVKRWGFDLGAYKKALHHNMSNELNYTVEATRQRHFGEVMTVDGLHVPMVSSELSRETILVQEWVEGCRLSEVALWSQTERLKVGKTLMQTSFQSLFEHGLVHGDPHSGNLLYERSPTGVVVHLLDYGCMVEVKKSRRLALLKLILAARGEDEVDLFDAFVALGFDRDRLANLKKELPAIVVLLFRPFTERRPFDTATWHLGQELTTLLGERRWWFRSAGPADLLLLMRVFQGLIQQLTLLSVALPFWPMISQAVSPATIKEAKEWTPPKISSEATTSRVATQLVIKITRGAEVLTHLAFPASDALALKSLIPTDTQERLEEAGVSIKERQQQIQEQGLVPQVIFSVDADDTEYRVWLE